MSTEILHTETELPEDNPWLTPYWNGIMTTFWALIIGFFWAVSQTAAALIAVFGSADGQKAKELLKNGGSSDDLQTSMMQLLSKGDAIWISAFVSSIVGVLIILLVIRAKKGAGFSDYLALQIPPLKQWGIWLGVFFVFSFVLEFCTRNIEGMESDFMAEVLANTGNLPMLALTVGVLGPIFEEVFFRGFIYRGWEKAIGGHATVFLTASIFAFMHYGQYNLTIVLAIIPMGLLFGYARMYSGSLTIPIALHVLNNLMATWLGISEMGA